MSFKHMQAVIDHHRCRRYESKKSGSSADILGTARSVLNVLAFRANDKGECWPSLPCIADDCGFGRSSVASAIGELERKGAIAIDSRGRKGKQARSNLYRITITESTPVRPAGGLTDKQHSPAGGRRLVRQADGSSSGRRTAVSPPSGRESSENSQTEPSVNRQGESAGLTDQRIDYQKTPPPRIRDYSDIHGCSDPILAAMAVTGERHKRSWGYWVKMFNRGRRESTEPGRAERLFLECVAETYGEMKQGEVRYPGAILNKKLQAVFK